jgi:hypothetical protein
LLDLEQYVEGPNAETVRALWRLMSEGRFREVAPLLADEFVCDWPLTRECIRGRDNDVALNEAYPGDWRIEVEELFEREDRVVTRCRLEWQGQIDYAISFFSLRHGLILHEVDWWPEPYDPPPGRERWVELLPDDANPITR